MGGMMEVDLSCGKCGSWCGGKWPFVQSEGIDNNAPNNKTTTMLRIEEG